MSKTQTQDRDAVLATLRANLAAFKARKATYGADVLRVEEWGADAQPVKLVVRCVTDPKSGVEGCGAEHVRKSADVHQALLCPSCRDAANAAKRKAKGRTGKAAEQRALFNTLGADLL